MHDNDESPLESLDVTFPDGMQVSIRARCVSDAVADIVEPLRALIGDEDRINEITGKLESFAGRLQRSNAAVQSAMNQQGE